MAADPTKLLTTAGKLSTGLALGGTLLELGLGISQLVQANKLKKTQRPVITTPKSLTDYVTGRKFRAGTYGLPGQGRIEAKMAGQTAATTRAIQQSGQSQGAQLAALAALDQQSKSQMADLGIQAAQQKMQNELAYDEAKLQLASEEMRQRQYNIMDPFDEKRKAYAALYQGGMTNLRDFASGTSKIFDAVAGVAKEAVKA